MRKPYLSQIVLICFLTAGLLMAGSRSWADDTAELKEQVQALQNQVNQLESTLATKPQAMMAMPFYDQWEDPFTQAAQMREQMEHSMRQAFVDTGAVFTPQMDMKQTGKQYVITMDIPGMDKNNIDVEIKEGMLIISGERQSDAEDNKNNRYYHHERSFGSFMQAIPLPDDAKKDRIGADYKDGVLTVTVERMKKEEKGPEDQKITVN